MESNKIPDSQITASSYKRYYEPHQARLHMTASASGNGAWCASTSYQQGEWLQVSTTINKKVVFWYVHLSGGHEGYQSDRVRGLPLLDGPVISIAKKIGFFSSKMKKKLKKLRFGILLFRVLVNNYSPK